MRYWRLLCESNQGPGQSREANSTCLQLRSILLLARTTSWLFPDGQTAGCESTFTLEHLGIAVSDVMCILCVENVQELQDGPAGCCAIKKEKTHWIQTIIYAKLHQQKTAANGKIRVRATPTQPQCQKYNPTNRVTQWCVVFERVQSCFENDQRKSVCYSYQSQCNKDTSASITGYG